jgi:hypothetical protein
MNDFTKKELEIILFWGMDRAENVSLHEFKSDGHDVVYKKVHSMIENYYDKGEFHE